MSGASNWRAELFAAEKKIETKDKTIAAAREAADKLRERHRSLAAALAASRSKIKSLVSGRDELVAKLTATRDTGNMRITGLKASLTDAQIRNQELKQYLRMRIGKASTRIEQITDKLENVKTAREILSARNEKLERLLAEMRKTTIGFDSREIYPKEHNTKEAMDTYFASIEDEEPYLTLAGSVKTMLDNNDVVLNDKAVLDIGVGPGIVLNAILEGTSPASVAGNDFSAVAIEQARKRMPDGHFEIHDIYDPQPAQADVVLSTEVLEHLERPADALRNILDAVAPGGLAVLTVPDGRVDTSRYHINFWSPESWRVFITKHGEGFNFLLDEFQTKQDVRSRINFALLRRLS